MIQVIMIEQKEKKLRKIMQNIRTLMGKLNLTILIWNLENLSLRKNNEEFL